MEPDTAPGTMSSCTNCDTGGNKLERVRNLRFLCFSELWRLRIASVGIYFLTPALGFRTLVFDGVNTGLEVKKGFVS